MSKSKKDGNRARRGMNMGCRGDRRVGDRMEGVGGMKSMDYVNKSDSVLLLSDIQVLGLPLE
jgi:hypothetical protein